MSKDDYNDASIDATISRIETKLDTFIEDQRDMKNDISSLKQFKYWLLGVVAVSTAIGDKLIDWILGLNK